MNPLYKASGHYEREVYVQMGVWIILKKALQVPVGPLGGKK